MEPKLNTRSHFKKLESLTVKKNYHQMSLNGLTYCFFNCRCGKSGSLAHRKWVTSSRPRDGVRDDRAVSGHPIITSLILTRVIINPLHSFACSLFVESNTNIFAKKWHTMGCVNSTQIKDNFYKTSFILIIFLAS